MRALSLWTGAARRLLGRADTASQDLLLRLARAGRPQRTRLALANRSALDAGSRQTGCGTGSRAPSAPETAHGNSAPRDCNAAIRSRPIAAWLPRGLQPTREAPVRSLSAPALGTSAPTNHMLLQASARCRPPVPCSLGNRHPAPPALSAARRGRQALSAARRRPARASCASSATDCTLCRSSAVRSSLA